MTSLSIKTVRKLKAAAVIGFTSLSLVMVGPAPAEASGFGYTPGPDGPSYNSTIWRTDKKGPGYEKLRVTGSGLTVTKANSCKYGMSIWYNDYSGKRRNIYWTTSGCTWGPVWMHTSPSFTAKRGTSVQVTYRWNNQWYPGKTFRIK